MPIPPPAGAAPTGGKFAGTGPSPDGEIGPDGVHYGTMFETMVRAWAKNRLSAAGSITTLEAFAFSYARSNLKGLDSQRAFLLYVGRRSRFSSGSPPAAAPAAASSSAASAGKPVDFGIESAEGLSESFASDCWHTIPRA